MPEDPNALIQLIKQIEANKINSNNYNKSSPLALVHCSAGVGRTGCFLAISLGMKQIDTENCVDIVRIVSNLRKERGGMIQTLEQYEYLYQILAYYCIYYKQKSNLNSQQLISLDTIDEHNDHDVFKQRDESLQLSLTMPPMSPVFRDKYAEKNASQFTFN